MLYLLGCCSFTQAPKSIPCLREVLQDDPGWLEGHLHTAVLVGLPIQDAVHILGVHLKAVTVPDCRLQEDAYRVWQPLCTHQKLLDVTALMQRSHWALKTGADPPLPFHPHPTPTFWQGDGTKANYKTDLNFSKLCLISLFFILFDLS